MKFNYRGMTRQRKMVEGSIEAVDEVEAKMKLRAMQIRPEAITSDDTRVEGTKRPSNKINFSRLNEISLGPPIDLKGLLIFTRQFSSLIDAGVPVVQCLDILAAQEVRAPFRRILLKVKSNIENGESLARSLEMHPRAFSSLMVSLVEAGEISGTLDQTLRRIGVQYEKLDRIRSKVKGAMVYPIITLVISVAVLAFLLVKVIPEVSKMYGTSELPELTAMVMDLSVWVQANYVLLFGYLIGLIVGMIVLYRVPLFRACFDPLVLRVPIIGSLILRATVARMSRTMATLISSGVPLLSVFTIVQKLIGNVHIRKIVEDTARGVSEGKSIAHGMSRGKVFPVMVVHMISIGEVSGKLDELMGKVADIYEEEVDEAVGTVTNLIQPVLIVGVGGIIAFLLIAMYLPIFQIAEKIAG